VTPRVSVILSTYNWSSVLRYSLASAARQTLRDIEILVEGDGCTDDSAEVVAALGDPRVQWHNLAVGVGSQSGPNNAGLGRAAGRYIAYLGHDDLWRSDHLERLVAVADASEADLVYSLAELIYPDRRVVSGLAGEAGLVDGETIPPSSLLHRRELIAAIGPWAHPLSTRQTVDAEFVARARRAGMRFAPVESLTVFKFPASARRDSYRERPCHEQAEYTRRLLAEPDFLEREWITLARSARRRPLGGAYPPTPPANAPLGWAFETFSQVRGLRPEHPPMEALALADAQNLHLALRHAPASALTGEEFEAQVELRNLSGQALRSAMPHPIHLSYHWLNGAGEVEVSDGLRSVLLAPLPPGGAVTLGVAVRAPATAGRRRLQLAVVQEEVRWCAGAGACETSVDVHE
jgi:GT2 family glycosyltransferase